MTNREKEYEIRHALEDMPCPICTKDMSAEDCVKLYDDIEHTVNNEFGLTEIDFYDEAPFARWWPLVGSAAMIDYGCEYYEDMTTEDYDKCKNWFSTWQRQAASDI